MAEHEPQKPDSMLESLLEKIDDKVHGRDDKVHGRDDKSSSSDSDHEEIEEPPEPKVFRLFGREKPLHQVLGGGKPADVLLWRNKKLSAGAVGIATALWALFELAHYHLLTLVCHALILVLAILFLWSNASTFIHKSPPKIPEVHIPEEPVLQLASALRFEVNRALAVLRSIASGRDLKKFLGIIAGLWVLSVIGTCCNFLTLFYIVFIILHTVPVFYEKYEDKVDPLAERALGEFNKQYSVFDAKVLSKIPRGPLAKKKD